MVVVDSGVKVNIILVGLGLQCWRGGLGLLGRRWLWLDLLCLFHGLGGYWT